MGVQIQLTHRTFVNKLGQYYDGALIMLIADQEENEESVREKSRNIERAIFFVNTETQALTKAVVVSVFVQ